jgi:DNA-binding transcriptional MerR regulator
MRTKEVLEKIDIPRDRLYYLEYKGFIKPKRIPMGEIEAREFSDGDFHKIQVIWKYLKQGFKYRVAYEKAVEELNNPQLEFTQNYKK